ncbi:MAG: 50S ribosomal protein L25/general stress protein Ctc [Zetaproteobacteria bacterium]|nr:MAG: 50S ribosomal protein L25/general stress protein Ctc [Zetaproteobacteria bacterium]
MADYRLQCVRRQELGRNAARRLRRQGMVPGIVYGGGKDETPIAVAAPVLEKLLREEHFHAAMIELEIEGEGKQSVVLKDTQYDPLTDKPIHVDFQRVRASDRIYIEVPVVAVNYEKCPGVVRGGVLEQKRHELEIVCRADSIPDHIEVDCSGLDIGDVVHVEDLKLPDGVSVPHEVNFTILTIAPPTVSEEEVAEEAEEETGEGEAS